MNAVARGASQNNLGSGDGDGRAEHHSNTDEEMKTVSKKGEVYRFVIYSARGGT